MDRLGTIYKPQETQAMVLVFKTSVTTKTKAPQIKSHLNKLLGKSNWKFDLEDCDKILRTESKDGISNLVIEELTNSNLIVWNWIELGAYI